MRDKFVLVLSFLSGTMFAQFESDPGSPGLTRKYNFQEKDLSIVRSTAPNEKDLDLSKLTPFAPKSKYETIGIKARFLPWVLGNAGGASFLLGVEFGFLRNNSISVDGMLYGTQDHHDNYFGPNDPRNRESDDYYGGDEALYFSYNYYFDLKNSRDEMGVAFYAGANYRLGKADHTWDKGISSDSILRSSRNYYSFGPQIGFIVKWGEKKHFALNMNIAGLYSTKDITEQRTSNLVITNYYYHLNSYDLKVGINLYWWFIRKGWKE